MERLTKNKDHSFLINYLKKSNFDYELVEKMIVKLTQYEDLDITPEKPSEMKSELERLKRFEAQRNNETCGNCKFWGEISGKCMSDCSNAGMVNRVKTDSCDWFKPKQVIPNLKGGE